MPRAKTARENQPKAERKPVEGMDAKVKVTIYSPEHEAKEFWATIPNIKGCSTWSTRSPESIMGRIIGGLRGHYGDKVK